MLLKDFKEVKDLYLEEVLTEEEMEEGLEPMEEFFKVCVTKHAYERMNAEFSRNCEYQLVEDLLLSKANEIMSLSMNEDFVILSDDKKLAVVGLMERIEGETAIILKTVIRKVYMDSNGNEIEKRVWVKKDSNLL